MRLQIITDFSAEDVAAYEDAIVTARSSLLTDDVISIWKQPNVVYIPHNASVIYFDSNYSKSFNFPCVRSPFFPAEGTSAVVVGNTWGLLCGVSKNLAPDRLSFENLFTMDIFKTFLAKQGLSVERVSNDLVFPEKGSKIAGIVSCEKDNCYFSNSFMNMKKQDNFDYDLFYKLPESKFEDKKVKSVNERIASVYGETGREIQDEDFINHVKEYLTSINIEFVEESGLQGSEVEIFNRVKDHYRSDKWINYGEYWSDDFIE